MFALRKCYTHSRRRYYIAEVLSSKILQDVPVEDRNFPCGFSLPKDHPGGGLQRGASELEGGEVCEWEVEFGV